MHNSYLLAISLVTALTSAQTFTECNPLEETCPANPAFGRSATYDSFSGTPQDFKEQSESFSYEGGEAKFVINKKGDAPTLISNEYIFFGSVSVVMKAASGTGIVSSVVLQSDDLDEIDWEWLGGDRAQVQTNYFGKGDTSSYDRATYVPVEAPQDTYHNYTINWSSEKVDWIIDDTVIRSLPYAEAKGGSTFPQTPMSIRLGNWAGGASDAEGTVEWAGGKTDFSQAPFTMTVRSISITDASSGSAYEYSDNSGSWESIKVLNGEGAGKSASEAQNEATKTASVSDSIAIGLPAGRTSAPADSTTVVSVTSAAANTTSVATDKQTESTATAIGGNGSATETGASTGTRGGSDASRTQVETGGAVDSKYVGQAFISLAVFCTAFLVL